MKLFPRKIIELDPRLPIFTISTVRPETVIINDRKYEIRHKGAEIIVRRKSNSLFDLMTFKPKIDWVYARGFKNRSSRPNRIAFEVGLKPVFKGQFLLYGLIPVIFLLIMLLPDTDMDFPFFWFGILGYCFFMLFLQLMSKRSLDGFAAELEVDSRSFR